MKRVHDSEVVKVTNKKPKTLTLTDSDNNNNNNMFGSDVLEYVVPFLADNIQDLFSLASACTYLLDVMTIRYTNPNRRYLVLWIEKHLIGPRKCAVCQEWTCNNGFDTRKRQETFVAITKTIDCWRKKAKTIRQIFVGEDDPMLRPSGPLTIEYRWFSNYVITFNMTQLFPTVAEIYHTNPFLWKISNMGLLHIDILLDHGRAQDNMLLDKKFARLLELASITHKREPLSWRHILLSYVRHMKENRWVFGTTVWDFVCLPRVLVNATHDLPITLDRIVAVNRKPFYPENYTSNLVRAARLLLSKESYDMDKSLWTMDSLPENCLFECERSFQRLPLFRDILYMLIPTMDDLVSMVLLPFYESIQKNDSNYIPIRRTAIGITILCHIYCKFAKPSSPAQGEMHLVDLAQTISTLDNEVHDEKEESMIHKRVLLCPLRQLFKLKRLQLDQDLIKDPLILQDINEYIEQ